MSQETRYCRGCGCPLHFDTYVSISSLAGSCFIGRLRGQNVGSIDIIVCGGCGLLYTSLRESIEIGKLDR